MIQGVSYVKGVREALPHNYITLSLHKTEWAALLQPQHVPPVCGAESKLHGVLVTSVTKTLEGSIFLNTPAKSIEKTSFRPALG